MEILGLTNTAMLQMQTQVQANEAKSADTFQSALDTAMQDKDKAKLRKACVDFEGYFVQMRLKEMRKSVDSSGGLFPKGQAEEIFEGMLDEEIAKSIAEGRGMGLADMMYKQLERNIDT
jgi:flagellar protein FlgJ